MAESNLEKRNRMEKEARAREAGRTPSKPAPETKEVVRMQPKDRLSSIPLGQRGQYAALLRDYEARKINSEPVGDDPHQYAMDRLYGAR